MAINGRAAVRREVGGVERVARELAVHLPALAPSRYHVLTPRPRLAHRAGHVWEQVALPVVARGAELVLSPANTAPVADPRTVVFIHDAAALRHPEFYRPAFLAYARTVLPVLVRRARAVVTGSAFSRGELVELLGADAGRVTVVPYGVGERFTPDADPGPARRAHGLARPYVLAVGTRTGRKNLAVLDAASRRLAAAGIELVAAGSGRGYMPAEANAPVRALGYVDEAHLPGLYAGALALAMPSRYEGFGLPCLEAMAAGTPVVASTAGALPETCGDAARLVDSEDAEGWAAALLELSRDAAARERLRARGLARAAGFGWSRTARETDALVGRLLAE